MATYLEHLADNLQVLSRALQPLGSHVAQAGHQLRRGAYSRHGQAEGVLAVAHPSVIERLFRVADFYIDRIEREVQLFSQDLPQNRVRARAAIGNSRQRRNSPVVTNTDPQPAGAGVDRAFSHSHAAAAQYARWMRRIPTGLFPQQLQGLTRHDALEFSVVRPDVALQIGRASC